jgi:asparagine synthase (glutamine-hydrolysing)
MCGICGVYNQSPELRTEKVTIQQMLEMIRHRGPDGFGIYIDESVALGNARLSIIDLETGDQPISNENETLWIICNGEIFNYIELRNDLERRGHRFSTKSDIETLLHAYEEYGVGCLRMLNGQFSVAIWDKGKKQIFLARDPLGITPLYYTFHKNKLIFGSEIKSILAYPGIQATINQIALEQVFTFWSVQSPQSIFKGIFELPPGHYLLNSGGQISIKPYWTADFSEEIPSHSADEYLDEFENLLVDAVRLRLRSDVPVGVYLSGGLDSSIVTSLISHYSSYPLETFSISFSDPNYDESHFQLEVAKYFNAKHHVFTCSYEDIGQIFPEVIWHTETPIIRTAPAPMYLLSKLVTNSGYRVVLTGEGADEFLAGYDIFKEMILRRFWARNPESSIRPLLFRRLYQDIQGLSSESSEYMQAFFKRGLLETDSPYYSHLLRWRNTARNTRFLLNPENNIKTAPENFPAHYTNWSYLSQAQYIETVTFLSTYLLSSQGDRMAMGNSVEARHPFLDNRVVDFCNKLPGKEKILGMKEKWILKRLGMKLLPDNIWKKGKRAYRAPINQCFFAKPLNYLEELLSKKNIENSGYLNTKAVTSMIKKASSSRHLGEVDSMAVAGIISFLLIDQLFIKNFQLRPINTNVNKYIER